MTPSPNAEQRWIVHGRDGGAAAYLALWRVSDTRFRMDLIVDPSHRRHGLGARLTEFLVAQARRAGATSLQARPYAEAVDALSMLAARGFRETMRMTGLALDDVAAADLTPAVGLDEALAARGIRITSLAAELARDPLAWSKLRDANQAAEFGWPAPDPLPNGMTVPPETAEEFRSRSVSVGMIEAACFIAIDAARPGVYVGYSALTEADPARAAAGSGGTAVRPEARGRGIATALKASCIRWAREHGVRRLATSSGNPAMIRVNEKFGFRRTYAEVRLVKRLG